MAKNSDTIFFCKSCGNEFSRWEGKCPACGEWDGLVEAPRERSSKKNGRGPSAAKGAAKARQALVTCSVPKPLHTYAEECLPRIRMPIAELHRVLGGGAVPGGCVLVGGEPGIGKSTLLLQMLGSLAACTGISEADAKRPLLYISGEEAPSQIAARGRRLGEAHRMRDATEGRKSANHPHVLYDFESERLLLASATDLERILEMLEENRPLIAVIDSIQTLRDVELGSAPGSVSQVREVAMTLVDAARRLDIAMFLIGHVTKDGTLAGPRVLEHVVDCVISFEGETRLDLRVLRGVKNRFGSTNEVGLFEMTGGGLYEVPDPSSVLLDRDGSSGMEKGEGVSVGAHVEGTRVLLVEIQALTVPVPGGGTPRRRASGLDANRLAMLLAVLETKARIPFGALDVFVSAAGGFRIEEPAADLPLALALASVATGRKVRAGLVAAGEIGLGGELRPVPRSDVRMAEAGRLGFSSILLPARGGVKKSPKSGLNVLRAHRLSEALALALE